MANTNVPDKEKWYFTKEYLENTPSRECGFDAYKELQYRQQAANFIQDMGQKLQVSQLCINTAIVYMHRFYVFHSFTNFPWHQIASAALFLAAKVEEQPRKLEYVIRVSNICRNPRDRNFDINSEKYATQSQDLVFNENVLLQTLGFDVAIDHPHTYIVRCCHLVRASKDLAQTSYFMASNSLHLTTMCIQYKPTVVACFCILLTCKWSNWEIPLSNEKKEWYTYVDPTVTADLLEQLTNEFLVIFENCPSRLKEKIMAKQESSSSPFEHEKKVDSRSLECKGDDHHKHRSSRPLEAGTSGHRSQEQREREYKERKEKERIAHMSGITVSHQPHHRPERSYSRPQPSATFPVPTRNEPREMLRDPPKDPALVASTAREHAKEVYGARSDKEVPKRDPLLKSYVQTDPNSLSNYSDARMQRIDPNRPRNEPPKSSTKLDMLRRNEDQKIPHVKHDAENIKKHLSSSFDRNSAYLKTSSSSSTSQKVKSPSSLDSKSVPRANSNHVIAPPKPQFNGNANGSYDNKPPVSHETDIKAKTEMHHAKEEIPTPAVIKRPSLFSPDQTPQHPQMVLKPEPEKSLTSLTLLSPINSPPSVPSMRNRNYSSGSEPELRPTMKKIDQVEGFENLMRDNTIGMTKVSSTDSLSAAEQQDGTHDVDVSTLGTEAPPQPAIVNGFETNPTLISNLLKEAATASHLSAVATTSLKPQETVEPIQSNVVLPPEYAEKEHRHHKSKKKKDKHKRKDKDKNKEEKEKKRKHKDKDRERSKHKERKEPVEAPQPTISEPIKIKIQKDKIQPLNQLKIKIPKDKIKTDGMRDSFGLAQPSSGGLKIKIPKDIITNCNASGSSFNSFDKSHSSSSSSSRKRDRSSSSELPATKVHKSSHKELKQNGRHSSSKVSKNLPSSSNSFHSSDQVDSLSANKIDNNETRHTKEVIITHNNAPTDGNFNGEKRETSSGELLSAPKFNSSMIGVVSPTSLPILATSDTSISPIPMSVKNSKTEISRDSGLSSSVSQEGFETSGSTSNSFSALGESAIPQGLPTNHQKGSSLSLDVAKKSTVKLASHPKEMNGAAPPYQQVGTTSSMDIRNPPPPYTSASHNNMFHNSNFKNRQMGSYNKHVRHNYDYPPPPPYHMKDTRGSRHMNSRFQQPMTSRHNRVVSNHHIPPMQLENPYPQLAQNQEMHYLMPQMAYNTYQVAPPAMPNVNMPPPPFGYFPSHYFEGYMMPELYQQQAAPFGIGVTQPPLPTDAPPASQVPPPPPPE